ncbi:MAG: hypothetical protein JXA10_01290 [Anaerolineae bacterium]|nr:hypothetical protein [Anaerolineae bacterium]
MPRLARPFGYTILIALLILALLIPAAEGLARLSWIEARIPAAVGAPNPYFDTKVGELDTLIAQEGRIDCLFIGSSVVNSGIVPARFEKAYYEATGQAIRCYNFAIPGVTASGVAKLADLLVERYRPRVLIYGFTLRAFSAEMAQTGGAGQIFKADWTRYSTGDWNLHGWIIDHSLAYRRYLALRDWPEADFVNPVGKRDVRHYRGFNPFGAGAQFFAPDYLFDYEIAPEEWDALLRLLALNTQTQVMLVEMPLPEQTVAVFEGGPTHYARYLDEVAAAAAEHSIPYIATFGIDIVPDNGWAGDTHHMSATGALVFSAWLGEQMGEQ